MVPPSLSPSSSSSGQRRRSLSPVRVSPRIQHVNGRVVDNRTPTHTAIFLDNNNVDIALELVAGDSDSDSDKEGGGDQPALVDATKVLRCSSLDVEASTSKRPRVRLVYQDDGLRSRFCQNALALIDLVHQDANTVQGNDSAGDGATTPTTTSALMARKALRYRHMLTRLETIDPRDPCFDVSQFFGVEWCKSGSG